MSEGTEAGKDVRLASTVLTLALDEVSQQRFELLRREHFPAALNRIPAHLTLFHTLPMDPTVRAVLARAALATPVFSLRVSGLMFLGRGVAYAIASEELTALHRSLAASLEDHLSAQDRQRFRPHVVVQNKVNPADAKALLARLEVEFEPWSLMAVGLDWWEYLGGPWRPIERFGFGAEPGGCC